MEIFRRDAADIVITDVRMPRVDGFEVLREVRAISPGTEVIMITGFRDIENAFRAIREGAFDFFTKPLKVQNLSASLQRTVRFQALRRERDRARERLSRIDAEARRHYGLSAIVGEGPAIREVRERIQEVCRSAATTVLVCGETGTGKELVTRAIHSESARSDGPFVAVDCSAIPESLVESEFYGHVKGAFTDAREAHRGHFELADGGTLFLDEIGDMDPAMQAKLLRTLEERRIRPVGGSGEIEVDVRVVSATNRDLPRAISEGTFREDLYYRLNAFTIHVPPLRECREDIPHLARHFLNRYAREMRKAIEGFTPEATSLLETHPFPGNVRELRNLIERAAILCKGGRVMPENLEFDPSASPAPPAGEAPHTAQETASQPLSPDPADLQRALRSIHSDLLNLSALEREAVREALRRCDGNQVRTAELLGISRTTLRRQIARYDLTRPESGVRDPERGDESPR